MLVLVAVPVLGMSWAMSSRSKGEGAAPDSTSTSTDAAVGGDASAGATSTTGPATTDQVTATTMTAITASDVRPTDRFAVAAGGSLVAGNGVLKTYTVEVEEGIPIDPLELAAVVDGVLADPRGWTASGEVALQRVGPDAAPSFRVRLATPATVDTHCAPLRTNGRYSCRQGMDVMINLTRWLEGAAPSGLTLESYRHYVISHEVGHALGHGHVGCPGPSALAPVMLQQTKGLEGCTANAWPYP